MLHSISWQQFFTPLILITLLYYAVAIFIYYRNAILTIRFSKINFSRPREKSNANEKKEIDQFDRASALSKILRANIKEAGAKQIVKEEALFSIQSEIKSYHDIIGTGLQVAINNLIEDCLEKECSIYLSAEDLGSIWKN